MSEYESDPGWLYLRQSQEKILSTTSVKFDSKKYVWIPDKEEGFIAAEIRMTKGDMVIVDTCKGTERMLKKDETQQMNPPKCEKIEDMANLPLLNDASVLHNLRERYFSMMIYTYSGLFCVVINPYKRLPIYTENICKMYIGKRRTEMPPHLFAVSDEAYRNMINDRVNQSMLITGESGAGKTENTKKVISYFATVGATHKSCKLQKCGKVQSSIEDQIVRTNPVLEAFGNAKTVRNNNSSRFGKFIRIYFNNGGKLAGADIEHYLLEKSRVINQEPGERCYHIFYQIMSGGIVGLKEKLFLTRDIRDYHLISQAEVSIDGVDDKEEMQITDESFDVMHFTEQEKEGLFALVAGIMHMGEIKFKQRPREEQAECENQQEGDLACKLWLIDKDNFISSLLQPRVKIGTEWVNKGQNLDQVNWAVGALAKAIYARMFAWLIKRCNKTLDVQNCNRDLFIGVLDIAGFEIFDFNSFEQLWINYVNEKLQQFFNHHMFVLEQEEYQREGIQWQFIDFGLDLQACIELIEKPLGIISMLDEECIVPKATDLTLAQKLNDQHLGKHPNFQKPKVPKGKQAEAHLAIIHYAGTVRYNVTGWLEKNKDPLNDTAVSVLKANTGMELMSQIWDDYKTQEDIANTGKEKATSKKKGKSASFMTASMMYRESLNNLMTMLYKTHPHFIRCIIPNEKKTSGIIDASLVLNQLTCNGVLEGIRICRKGFPNRNLHNDFQKRYSILATDEAASETDAKQCAEKMCLKLEKMGALKQDDYRIGNTKVFFKAGVIAHLEEFRDQALSVMITKFQSACRHYYAQCDLRNKMLQKVAVLTVQRNVRIWCKLRNYNWYILHGRVRQLIRENKKGEELQVLKKKVKQLEQSFDSEEKRRKNAESQILNLKELFLQLQREKDMAVERKEEAVRILLAQKGDIEMQYACLNKELIKQKDRNVFISEMNDKVKFENETLKRTVAELESTCEELELDKKSKDNQIRSIQVEIISQDEIIAKVNKEKRQQEEKNGKLLEVIQAEVDKVNYLCKMRKKLEQRINNFEEDLKRERRVRQNVEKAKCKAEGELNIAQENTEKFMEQKHEIENALERKDAEMNKIMNRIADGHALVNKLQNQLEDQQRLYQKLQNELQTEKRARLKALNLKAEENRSELKMELGDRLDESDGATQMQTELNKECEAELLKLRRELEEASTMTEAALVDLREKRDNVIMEFSEQISSIERARFRVEWDKCLLQRVLDDLRHQFDQEVKQCQSMDRIAKQLKTQLADTQLRSERQDRLLQDANARRMKLQLEISDINRQLESYENHIGFLNYTKQQLTVQMDEMRQQLEQELHEKHMLISQLLNLQMECQQLHDMMAEEQASKLELQRLILKANAETHQWRARFECKRMNQIEKLIDAKCSLQRKVQKMQEEVNAANNRIEQLKNARHRFDQELENAQMDANEVDGVLDKKQKSYDKIIDKWKNICDALDELQTNQEAEIAIIEALRLCDSLENDEEQQALNEAQIALKAEKIKLLNAKIKMLQIRSEIEKRIFEEEEFEITRNNHLQTLETIQAQIKDEQDERTDLREQLETVKRYWRTSRPEKEESVGKLEQQLHTELDETLNDLRSTKEWCWKVITDVERLGKELQMERQDSRNLERQLRHFELQMKDIQIRLNDTKTMALINNKNVVAKLAQRIFYLELELAEERRSRAETLSSCHNKDRQIIQLRFQIDKDKKDSDRMNDFIKKLQMTIDIYKEYLEEVEQMAIQNLGKYQRMQRMFEIVKECANLSGNSLTDVRIKNRCTST